jgi:transcriptional regulator GlxA family with amidase domain
MIVSIISIEAVKKKSQMVNTKSTLLGIAFDCGFNSKATFQPCFQEKNAGKTRKNTY